MFRILLCVGVLIQIAFGQWTMFSDGVDTYLYNTQSGDVYIRYKKGGKNYEDVFIKMPAGIAPKNQSKIPQTSLEDAQSSKNQSLEAIQKSQELLRQSMDSGLLE